jgi:pimeloyl-ACP methyl ester carboxylesterase
VYWSFLQKFLPERGLFIHDLEGHGDSEAPARFSGIGKIARRVAAVAAGQKADEGRGLIGMGHSFGAALTLKVAADNPGLFKALVLLDPIVFPPPVFLTMKLMSWLGMHPMVKAALRRRREWASRQEALDRLRDRGIYTGWPEAALVDFIDSATHDEGGKRVLNCPPELEAQIYANPVYPWPSFRKARLPVLFLHGADSYKFFSAAASLAKRANSQVDVATSPGHHCFMLEDPAAAAATVQSWLNAGVPVAP